MKKFLSFLCLILLSTRILGQSCAILAKANNMFSVDGDPSHTYYIPGNYIVSLTVTNIAGQSIHNVIITVYQNPVAVFNVYPTEVTNNSQIVVFSNYSYYDEFRFWKFSDGTTSSEENPLHKYETVEQEYSLKIFLNGKRRV